MLQVPLPSSVSLEEVCLHCESRLSVACESCAGELTYMLCAQLPTFSEYDFRPLSGEIVKVESSRACGPGGRFTPEVERLTTGGGRLALEGGVFSREGGHRVNLTPEAFE